MTDDLRLDELVRAVVRKLPAPGAPFPAEARDAWLKMMAMAFDVSYGATTELPAFLPASREPGAIGEVATSRQPQASPSGPRRFYVSADGRALKDPGAKPITVNDVPVDDIIHDERPLGQRDLSAITWADGNWPAAALPPLNFN